MISFKISKIELWKLAFIPVLFLYIYVPTFQGIGGLTKFYLLFAGFYFLFNYKKLLSFIKNNYIFKLVILLVCVVVVTIAIPLIYSSYDFSFANYFIVSLIINLPLTFLILSFFNDKIDFTFDDIIYSFFIIATLQSFFVILDWFSSEFRNILQSILVIDFDIEKSIRATGLSYGTGDALSFIQAIGFLSGVHYLYYYKKNYTRNIIFLCLILLSTLFIGRTGLVISLLGLGLYTLILAKSKILSILKLYSFLTFIVLIVFIIGLNLMDERLLKIMEWAFEFYFSFIDSGTLETSSTTAIQNMYFLPASEWAILFGEGYYSHPYTKEANYIDSDSGYIRTIFFGGFFTLVLLMGMYLYVWWIFKKLLDNKEFLFVSLLFMLFFIAHYKIPMLYYGYSLRIIFVLLIVSYFVKYQKGIKS